MIRTLVRAAHVISMIFTPFCLPVVGMLVLFIFSYLSLLPWGYKGMVLAIVCIFTMLMPVVLITIYSKLQGNNKIKKHCGCACSPLRIIHIAAVVFIYLT